MTYPIFAYNIQLWIERQTASCFLLVKRKILIPVCSIDAALCYNKVFFFFLKEAIEVHHRPLHLTADLT